MQEILNVQNVVKYYGGGSVVTKALDGISFTVSAGEFIAVMGASGSGKSTLLNIISTIDTVSAGSVRIDGQDTATFNEKQLAAFRRDKLGFVFQDYNLLDTLTVGENIALPLNLRRLPPDAIDREVKRAANALDVADQLNKFPYELAGGQRQRAACARAIITDPVLILADEPTCALDSKNSKLLMETFAYMNQGLESTVLMVTHDATVASYAKRVLFLKDGKIFDEILRGDRSRSDLYADIVSVTTALGGGDVR